MAAQRRRTARRARTAATQRAGRRRVARDAARPGALGLDEAARPLARLAATRRAARARARWRRGQRLRVARREQEAGLAVADQLAVAADVGGDEHASLRHRLERLQRRDQLGQAHRLARIDEHVDQLVVALHLGVRHAAGEDDAVRDAQRARPAPSAPPPAARRRPAAPAASGASATSSGDAPRAAGRALRRRRRSRRSRARSRRRARAASRKPASGARAEAERARRRPHSG